MDTDSLTRIVTLLDELTPTNILYKLGMCSSYYYFPVRTNVKNNLLFLGGRGTGVFYIGMAIWGHPMGYHHYP